MSDTPTAQAGAPGDPEGMVQLLTPAGERVAHPHVAGALAKAATPFGVSALAQAAVVASLQPEAER